MPLSNFVLRRYGHEDNEREDVRLPMGRIEFGRTNKCYKQFESIYVSRMHCRITVQNDAISIKDANVSKLKFSFSYFAKITSLQRKLIFLSLDLSCHRL